MVVIDGIKEIIERDLEEHTYLLERTKQELSSFREGRSHEIKKKKHYNGLIGGEKYDDDSLREAMKDIATNIRHMSDKCTLAEEKIKHHQLIVDTLTEQLSNQNWLLAQAELYYQEHPEERPNGNEHQLGN